MLQDHFKENLKALEVRGRTLPNKRHHEQGCETQVRDKVMEIDMSRSSVQCSAWIQKEHGILANLQRHGSPLK